MMNIAIINIRELLKNSIKIIIIISLIFCVIQCGKMINSINQKWDIKEVINNKTKKINEYSFIDCLDLSVSLFSYTKAKSDKNKILTNDKILIIGSEIFNEETYIKSELIKSEKELVIDEEKELPNKIIKLPNDVTTEIIAENNIIPKVTSSYDSVQINNQSEYAITEEMLKPDVEITNKKDILIFHTHTCESYTPSPRL